MHIQKSILALIFVVAACGDPSDPGQQQPIEDPRAFTVQETALASASVNFGLTLLREVASGEADPNLMISPLSASMALGMAMNGAVGKTWDDMRAALAFNQLSESEINAAYKGLIAQLRARDPKIEFKLANSVWYERTFTVQQPFIDAGKSWFDAEVTPLDFRAPDAPARISKWASDQTNGRIKDLVKEIDAQEMLFLVNATYFKASWSSQFDPNSTRNQAFHRATGGDVTARMMSRDGQYRYVENTNLTASELFYGDSSFSMVVMMPPQGGSLAALSARLTPAFWNETLAAMRAGRVMLALPKFTFLYDIELTDALTSLGMGIAFKPFQANFTRIANRDDLYITRVQQNTFIIVDEKGTEAAAATSVGIGVTSLPPSITFDRPFLFAIRERESGAILFIGRVGDPTK